MYRSGLSSPGGGAGGIPKTYNNGQSTLSSANYYVLLNGHYYSLDYWTDAVSH